jgi:hypothetical protein
MHAAESLIDNSVLKKIGDQENHFKEFGFSEAN